MIDPTVGSIIVGALALAGVVTTTVVGNRSIKTLLVYRVAKLEEREKDVDDHEARLVKIEAHCEKQGTECMGRFTGAKRDVKEALDEHLIQCHPGKQAVP